MTSLNLRTTLYTFSLCMMLVPASVLADHDRRGNGSVDSLFGIISGVLASEQRFDRRHSSDDHRARHPRRDRGYHESPRSNFSRDYGDRNGFANSITTEPIRGGSSRRTRIVENPFPGRPLNGISFTGIERGEVHINDVITYPRRRQISHRGYSLSIYHPSAFLPTRGYVDYISVKAKRKEYFTVTFHYE